MAEIEKRPPVLEISDLKVHFLAERHRLKAVDGVSFHIDDGETIGLVGESGCGKSVTAFSILRLLPEPPASVSGTVILDGQSLLELSEKELSSVRGNKASIIFQDPMSSLNPIMTIGSQIAEVIVRHKNKSKPQAREIAIEMLHRVGMPSPEAKMVAYPHQLSGGMKQRVMIAMALACQPKLLIADEPTTALDVTIQSQILDLLAEIQAEFGMSILLITHDLGIVAQTCNRVLIMYAGRIVERGTVAQIFDNPSHPYTQGLFRCLPSLAQKAGPLPTIPGVVPSAMDFPSGCRFRTRCPIADDICKQEPPQVEIGPGHQAACHFAGAAIEPAIEAVTSQAVSTETQDLAHP